MASDTIDARPAGARVERYRQAERALWAHYGLNPAERWVELKQPPARLRLLETGSGAPVLFVHGTAGPGSWPALIRELRGFRCLVLDRPGWGLSSAVDFVGHEYQALVADMLRGVLDGLGLERAHVVGGSIGDVWALRLAARHPARVNRVVLLGGGPVVPQVRVPPVIRLIASPAGALMVRMPANPQRVRSILRNSGHGASLDAGRFPESFIDWRVALERDTHSMRNEREMVRAVVRGNNWRPGLTFDDAELAAIERPTMCVYGTADPVGTADLWRHVTELVPRGKLVVLNGLGHQPWLDDPSGVAAEVDGFLADGSGPA